MGIKMPILILLNLMHYMKHIDQNEETEYNDERVSLSKIPPVVWLIGFTMIVGIFMWVFLLAKSDNLSTLIDNQKETLHEWKGNKMTIGILQKRNEVLKVQICKNWVGIAQELNQKVGEQTTQSGQYSTSQCLTGTTVDSTGSEIVSDNQP